jgi:DNA-binding response OmpR family regulator
MKVLVIDDDQSICEVMRVYLERQGYKTMTANRADLGKSMALDFRPNVIICDLALEDADGAKLCTELSKLLPQTKICLFSGAFDSSVPPPGFPDFDVIPKPISMSELMRIIGPPQSKTLEVACNRKFVLVLKSGPPRFTFSELYDRGLIVKWVSSLPEAEKMLESYPYDAIFVDVKSDTARVQEVCRILGPFGSKLRIIFLKDPAINFPSDHCGDLVMDNTASREEICAQVVV